MRHSKIPIAISLLVTSLLGSSVLADPRDEKIRQLEAIIKLQAAQLKVLNAKVAELEARLKGPSTRKSAGGPGSAGRESRADTALRQKLQREAERVSFSDIDFKDVLQFLREYSKADIRVNWPALRAAGIKPDTRVNVDVRGATIKRVLDLILRNVSTSAARGDAELGYAIEDGVLTISTKGTMLSRVQRRNLIAKRAASAEISKAFQRARERLAHAKRSADFDEAEQSANLAAETLEACRSFFGAIEYRNQKATIDGLLKTIAARRDTFNKQKATAMAKDIERIKAERRLEAQRKLAEKVRALTEQAKGLRAQKKYDEALRVLNLILLIDPKNTWAAAEAGQIKQIKAKTRALD
jgi:hypothetical protein